jgi:hypothetical protein
VKVNTNPYSVLRLRISEVRPSLPLAPSLRAQRTIYLYHTIIRICGLHTVTLCRTQIRHSKDYSETNSVASKLF